MCGRRACEVMLCTWGEDYRRLCEARTVARWPKSERVAFYALVTKKRGAEAAQQLVDDIRAIASTIER